MSLVVDASVAITWFWPFPESGRAEELLRSTEPLIAPELVIAEIANAAWRAATFERLALQTAKDAVRESSRFFGELVPSIFLKDRAFEIAMDLRHPIYDCFYLALAETREAQLVTLDGRLLRRCANTPFAAHVKPL
jgi:predicted nucleic acid-binding protein